LPWRPIVGTLRSLPILASKQSEKQDRANFFLPPLLVSLLLSSLMRIGGQMMGEKYLW